MLLNFGEVLNGCTCSCGETGRIAQTKPNLPVDVLVFFSEHGLDESSLLLSDHVTIAASSKIQPNQL